MRRFCMPCNPPARYYVVHFAVIIITLFILFLFGSSVFCVIRWILYPKSDLPNDGKRAAFRPQVPPKISSRSFRSETRAALGVNTSELAIEQASFILKLFPHLNNDLAALRPAYHMTRGRKYSDIVIGIPTVKRDNQSYLMATLKNLTNGLKPSELNTSLIVVCVGETDLKYIMRTAVEIETMFPQHVDAGLIEVISPPPSYYPNLEILTETLGVSHERFEWRSKQILDTIYLMAYAQSRAAYYLMLEDDVEVIAKTTYMQIEIRTASEGTTP